MGLYELILLSIYIITSIGGQFFLKTGALKINEIVSENIVYRIIEILLIPELVGGLLFYSLGTWAYIFLLARVNLSIAAPALSVTYIFSIFIGYFLFGENIPISRIVGSGLITAGVILVIWKS
ncbi:EamA family transporter [Picosynechococcus sp. PCC 7117]|uniref:EamA family transporter n=1 Tax=Picosynechococcus sp. PCC 7117 TaxID=195498 RepID=UPI00081064BC|nr:EamA family transporter [Picosynechococcus sp. PCC 7117]ANV88724.1 EamA-like transporter family protein [Picosynechococcus sp. PCC 7117]